MMATWHCALDTIQGEAIPVCHRQASFLVPTDFIIRHTISRETIASIRLSQNASIKTSERSTRSAIVDYDGKCEFCERSWRDARSRIG